jgi:hypothetical protein
MVAAISVVIGVIMSILSLRNYSKSRQATVFLDFHKQADLEFIELADEIIREWNWTDFKDFTKKYGPNTNPKAYAKFIHVGSFFDSMGKLIKENVTSAKLIPETLAVFAVTWFEKIKSIENDLAAKWRVTGSIESTEILYKKLKGLGYRSPVEPDQSGSGP